MRCCHRGCGELPANSKRPSKLLGAWARRAVRSKVLEHVVQRKSPPLVGFNSLPVASLLSPAAAATSSRAEEAAEGDGNIGTGPPATVFCPWGSIGASGGIQVPGVPAGAG